jgi:Domain of unknown function (DUF4157)
VNAPLQNQAKIRAKPSLTPPVSGLLQCKCACGNETMAGGECEECSKNKRLGLQTKLQVNELGDQYEREADRIADQMLAGSTETGSRSARPRIQRFSGRSNEQLNSAPASVDDALRSPGKPLNSALRQEMEQRFGHDFSRVRVHSGAVAAQSARDVNAHAYTVGQDIVFGASQYAPETSSERYVLAHELTHVVQQDGGVSEGKGAARLQRLSLLEEAIGPLGAQAVSNVSVSDVLEGGATVALGPGIGRLVHLQKQFIDDLVASVKESPQHVGEFLKDEVWESIKNHWLQILAVTTGLILAETVVGALAAAPDPTLLTKVIAVILQIAIIAILGYFAAVEVKGAYEEGGKWISAARKANGDPKVITEASRSFVRMVWHIVMTVLVVAGVRARVRGFTVPEAAATGGTAGGAAAGGEGGTVTDISSHPKFQPRPASPPSGQVSLSAFGPGGTARQLAPVEQPLADPVTLPRAPTPAPAAVKAPSTTPVRGPGVQPVPAGAAGLAAATSKGRKGQTDSCKVMLGLDPGMNARWHRQRAPIAGHTTVSSAAFRLDPGINPPVGQDTTPASRQWVRTIGLPKDDAGHVIANRFGGRADFNSPNGNIFPQDLSFNRGTMRSYDSVAAGLHQRGCYVCAHIGLNYDSPTDLRPSSALYTILYRSPGAAQFNPPIGPVQVPNP